MEQYEADEGEVSRLDLINQQLDRYKEAFMRACIGLEEMKSQWKPVTPEGIEMLFSDVRYEKGRLFDMIANSLSEDASDFARSVTDSFGSLSGREKRSLIDIRAFLISNGMF